MATKKAPKNELEKYGIDSTSIVELANQKVDALKLQISLANAPCSTPAQYAFFSENLNKVCELHSKFDEKRTAITKPMLAAKRAVDALFEPVLKPLKKCEEVIRGKLKAYKTAEFNAEQALLQKASLAAQAGDVKGATLAIEAMPQLADGSGNTSSLTWKVKSVNISVVHHAYLTLNEEAVKAFVATHVKTGSTEPPILAGIEFEADINIRKRST